MSLRLVGAFKCPGGTPIPTMWFWPQSRSVAGWSSAAQGLSPRQGTRRIGSVVTRSPLAALILAVAQGKFAVQYSQVGVV